MKKSKLGRNPLEEKKVSAVNSLLKRKPRETFAAKTPDPETTFEPEEKRESIYHHKTFIDRVSEMEIRIDYKELIKRLTSAVLKSR